MVAGTIRGEQSSRALADAIAFNRRTVREGLARRKAQRDAAKARKRAEKSLGGKSRFRVSNGRLIDRLTNKSVSLSDVKGNLSKGISALESNRVFEKQKKDLTSNINRAKLREGQGRKLLSIGTKEVGRGFDRDINTLRSNITKLKRDKENLISEKNALIIASRTGGFIVKSNGRSKVFSSRSSAQNFLVKSSIPKFVVIDRKGKSHNFSTRVAANNFVKSDLALRQSVLNLGLNPKRFNFTKGDLQSKKISILEKLAVIKAQDRILNFSVAEKKLFNSIKRFNDRSSKSQKRIADTFERAGVSIKDTDSFTKKLIKGGLQFGVSLSPIIGESFANIADSILLSRKARVAELRGAEKALVAQARAPAKSIPGSLIASFDIRKPENIISTIIIFASVSSALRKSFKRSKIIGAKVKSSNAILSRSEKLKINTRVKSFKFKGKTLSQLSGKELGKAVKAFRKQVFSSADFRRIAARKKVKLKLRKALSKEKKSILTKAERRRLKKRIFKRKIKEKLTFKKKKGVTILTRAEKLRLKKRILLRKFKPIKKTKKLIKKVDKLFFEIIKDGKKLRINVQQKGSSIITRITQDVPKRIGNQIHLQKVKTKKVIKLKSKQKLKTKVKAKTKQSQLSLELSISGIKKNTILKFLPFILATGIKSTSISKALSISQLQRLGIKELPKLSSLLKSKAISKINNIVEQSLKFNSNVKSSQIQSLASVSRLSQILGLSSAQLSRLITKQLVSSKKVVVKIPKFKKKSSPGVQGWSVQVRVRRKFRTIAKRVLNNKDANSLGRFIDDTSLAASFRVVKSKRNINSGFSYGKAFKFRPAKTLKNSVVERRKFRIDSIGEVRGLSVARLLKLMRLSIIPLRRRKSKRKIIKRRKK